jgi:hypothetical protein
MWRVAMSGEPGFKKVGNAIMAPGCGLSHGSDHADVHQDLNLKQTRWLACMSLASGPQEECTYALSFLYSF